MLKRIVSERWLRADAVVGLFPANSDGDDILVHADSACQRALAGFTSCVNRASSLKGNTTMSGGFHRPVQSGRVDYLGAFACTAGTGIDARVSAFEADHDDFNAIMLKAVADRLAEALAEWLHRQDPPPLLGYAADEILDYEQLIAEAYQGIRPALGYPACRITVKNSAVGSCWMPNRIPGYG